MNTNRINNVNSNLSPSSPINSLLGSAQQAPAIDFDNVLAEVVQQNKGSANLDALKALDHNFNATTKVNFNPNDVDVEKLLAQGVPGQGTSPVFEEVERRRRERELARQIAEQEYELSTQRYVVTPFQMFIDKSIEVLNNISTLDYRVNDLTEQFMRGEVSIDEVSFEINKLNLAITFATTVISSASQTFKELTQLQI
tara:strand:- start:7598 stop:8191 length:594 start_codon:yes stop_codon:yes gene_type:complete